MKKGDSLKEWLKKIREEKEKTQEEIAVVANLSRSHYTNIENGERRPSVETAKKIAEELGFDWTRFYEDESETV